ncbi:hypothetical protein CFP56_031190 [Quercus suber]|uniref:DUF642 domain-containing protein n=2 Tax=Quercus suber TaxID=58331 RepID=A0AAW0JMQ0_QUESU
MSTWSLHAFATVALGGGKPCEFEQLLSSISIRALETTSPQFAHMCKLKHFTMRTLRRIAFLSVLFCATCHIALGLSIPDGLLPNGDFEYGPKQSELNGTVVLGRYAVPKWEISGFVEYIKSGQKQGDMLLVVPAGAYAVRLGNEASIKQRIKVIKGILFSSYKKKKKKKKKNHFTTLLGTQNVLAYIILKGTFCYYIGLPGAMFFKSQVCSLIYAGLLPNGDFEYGPKQSELNGTVVLGRYAVPKWEISGFVEYIKSGQKQGDMLLVVPAGAYAVRLGNEASIKQRIKVIKGMYYSLTFSAARTCAQEEKLNVSVAPDSGVLPMQTLYSSNGWDSYAWAFQADYDVADIVIHNPGVEEDPACGPLIDSVAIRALYPPRPTNTNLLKNYGFEEGPYLFPNTSWGVLIPPNIEDDHSPLPGWMVESLKAVKYIDSNHFSVPEGKRAVELVAGKESAIAQIVRTVPGKTYTLTFAVGDASNSCEGSMIVEAFAGRDTVKVPYESKGKGGFKRAVLKFVAVSTRTRIMFLSTFYTMRSDDFSSLCGPVLDDVKLVSVRHPRRMY